jgi:thioredoxin-related protein
MSWQEAVEANKKEKKKIFVYVYAEGESQIWCREMETTTFIDPEVIELINKHFYAVYLNAYQKEDIVFDNHTFKYPNGPSKSMHELAKSLLDGEFGFPSFVYLDDEFKRASISKGYRKPKKFLPELNFIGEGHYMTKTYEQYLKVLMNKK